MARFLPSLFGRDRDDPSFGREGEPFGSLFREVERVFDDFSRRSRTALPAWAPGALAPRIDLSESGDAIEVTAELPGVEEKDIDVTLTNGVLTIKAEKKIERDEKDKDWHVVERSYGHFVRSIPLGFDPASDAIDARFDKGVLTVRLPKPAEAKNSKKIPIKGH